MNDLISRKQAIDALDKRFDDVPTELTAEILQLRRDLRELPSSVQPDVPDTNVGDTISRQAAIDRLIEYGYGRAVYISVAEAVIRIEELPSAEPEREQMYKKAFSVACELLIGANLFGTTAETMFKEIMNKEGIVSSLGYEKYILDNLARLTGDE